MPPATTPRTRRDGCGFVIATTVFTCLFLVINGIVLTSSYGMLAEFGPDFLQKEKIKQLILFMGPVAMIFAEWSIIDWLAHKVFGGLKK